MTLIYELFQDMVKMKRRGKYLVKSRFVRHLSSGHTQATDCSTGRVPQYLQWGTLMQVFPQILSCSKNTARNSQTHHFKRKILDLSPNSTLAPTKPFGSSPESRRIPTRYTRMLQVISVVGKSQIPLR